MLESAFPRGTQSRTAFIRIEDHADALFAIPCDTRIDALIYHTYDPVLLEHPVLSEHRVLSMLG